MHLSAMLTSLPLAFEAALLRVRDLGFAYTDVVALGERPYAHREALADSGLLVGCATVGRELKAGHTLDAVDVGVRRAALQEMKRQVADAARLGAAVCYVIPGTDGSAPGLERFGEACALLADHAAARRLRLCVEHVPGRALPTVKATLAWLERVGHDDLGLLLDVGHCLISDEDPTEAVVAAGPRLGYVHLDDNDSVDDLHWPLLSGRLTSDMLEAFLTALDLEGYRGGLALELSPTNPDPVRALREGKEIVRQLAPGVR